MKSASKKNQKTRVELSGYVLGKDSAEGAAMTLIVALDFAVAETTRPMNIVLVTVTGPLAGLCRNELLFGDQILVQGLLRSRSFQKASGVLCAIRQLDALMITPLHPMS